MPNIPYMMSILAILLCAAAPLHAAGVKDAVPGNNGILIQNLCLFEDTTGSLGIREVASPSGRAKFAPADEIPNYGFTRSAVWIRFVTPNNSRDDIERILEVLYPALNCIEVFIPDGEGGYLQKRSGSRVPFTAREIRHRNSLFLIPVKAGKETEVYVRVRSSSALNFTINLYDLLEFQRRDYIEQFITGLFFGILTIMMLYNLFLFFSVGDRSYLFYVLYTLSNTLFSLSIHGLAYEFLWPNAGEWAIRSHPFFTATTLLCAILFSVDFLRIKKYSIPFYRVLQALAALAAVGAAGALFMPYRYCIRVNIGLSYLFLPLVIIAGVYTMRQGYRPARYFLAAWSFLVAGSLLYALSHSGVVPRNLVTEHAVQISTAIELSLLALALGDRINILRKEKEEYESYRELDRVKSEFVSNISHEIRTPLTLMLTPIWAVIDGSRSVQPDMEFFRMLDRNGSRLLGLINDLLDFSKLDAGRMTMRVAHADIQSVVRDHAAAVKSACDLKSISVEMAFEAEPVMLYFDPEKMDSVFTNLFSNAIGFTGHGGRISVRVNEGAKAVMIDFEDNGRGIPADKTGSIFDRFSQAGSGDDGRPGGTGIGLALVREFLALHGGDITVESRYVGEHPDDHGTRFRITLPKGKSHFEGRADVAFSDEIGVQGARYRNALLGVSAKGGAEAASAAAQSDTDERPLIMAVDDNADMHELLRDVLSPSYRLIGAADAKAALDLLQSMEEPPDLILSDVMMPGMDGYALTERIRSDPRFDGIPLILLTAKADTSMKIEGLETGATDYIAKPFSARELVARINAHLGMKRLRDRLARSNERLYSRLKKSGRTGEPLPNPEIEEKIGIVTEFIRENYTADISREGLAAAVDMSPDYLSRMFNRVTGKRLDEYINELRAAEAAKRLIESDETVLSIAMDTGFESLRHFNRVFNKIYSMNPTEYRRSRSM